MRCAALGAALVLSVAGPGCASGRDAAGAPPTSAEAAPDQLAASIADDVMDAEPAEASAPGAPAAPGPAGEVRTATGAAGAPRDERITTPAGGRAAAGLALAVGACFNETIDDAAPRPEPVVSPVPCEAPHDAQAFARYDFAAGPTVGFPGDREVERDTARRCAEEFARFVGRDYATSSLRIGVLRPTALSWNAGDRVVLCSLYDKALAPLGRSMAGSGA
ncbi:MAG: septum formation family protein [Acidimicrobiales bacterium]